MPTPWGVYPNLTPIALTQLIPLWLGLMMSKSKSPAPASTPSRLKVAIIGIGGISGTHFKSIQALPELEMVGSCDIVAEKAQKAAAERGGRAYTSSEKMMDVEKPDLVMLCTPQMVRLDPIRLCAERRIPIFIEKPPADTLERAKKIEGILKKHPTLHLVGFVFRYLVMVDRAMQLLKGRKILMLRQYYFCPMSLEPGHEKFARFYFQKEVSGGLVGDQAIHCLDLVRYITQSEVAEVQGFGNNIQHPKRGYFTSEETVSLNLRMTNQVVVSHVHSWAHPQWKCEMEILAVGAHLKLDLFNNKFEGDVDGMKVSFAQEDNGYLNELKALLQAIRAQSMKPVRSSYSDSVKTFATVLALNKSLETGERITL